MPSIAYPVAVGVVERPGAIEDGQAIGDGPHACPLVLDLGVARHQGLFWHRLTRRCAGGQAAVYAVNWYPASTRDP
jgi:hypothetical protein